MQSGGHKYDNVLRSKLHVTETGLNQVLGKMASHSTNQHFLWCRHNVEM